MAFVPNTVLTAEALNAAFAEKISGVERGAANGVATLGEDAKIPESQLPAIAITDTFPVDDEAAMLELPAQRGDLAVRLDIDKTFVLAADPPSVLENWIRLRTPTDFVLSVAGKTGAVTLTPEDVGAEPASESIVKTASTQTLTNKTLGGAILSGDTQLNGPIRSNIVAVDALNIDCSAGIYFTKSIDGAATLTFSNAPEGAYAFTLELTHISGAVTWPTSVRWPGDIAPTLTEGNTHIFVFISDDGGTRWRGATLIDYVN